MNIIKKIGWQKYEDLLESDNIFEDLKPFFNDLGMVPKNEDKIYDFISKKLKRN